MNWFNIENDDEIRCAYCLSWNNKADKICLDCTAQIISPKEFGAARMTARWDGCDPRHLHLHLKEESDERKEYWSNLFAAQTTYILKLVAGYSLIGPKLVHDLKEEIEKGVLTTLPMEPEIFKRNKEFEAPGNHLSEIEQLKYIFRSHPFKGFRMLAGTALIYEGHADHTVFDQVCSWKAPEKKLHLERLLSFAHWSIPEIGPVFKHKDYCDEILPLVNSPGLVGEWAALFLYLAGHSADEMKLKVKALMNSSSKTLALSCASALNERTRIKDILKRQGDISTLPLFLRYADENDGPELLTYLNHGPEYFYQKILNKLSRLKINQGNFTEGVVNWLFEKGEVSYFDVVFYWDRIPFLGKIIDKLISSVEGIEILKYRLPQWIERNLNEAGLPNEEFEKILNLKSSSDEIKGLKIELVDSQIQYISNRIQKKPSVNDVITLCHYLFQVKEFEVSNRQRDSILYGLYRSMDFKDESGKALFSLEDEFLISSAGSVGKFFEVLEQLLSCDETRTNSCSWNEKICEIYSSIESEVKYNSKTIEQYLLLLGKHILADQVSGSLTNQYFKFVLKTKSLFSDFSSIESHLLKIQQAYPRHDTNIWISKILS